MLLTQRLSVEVKLSRKAINSKNLYLPRGMRIVIREQRQSSDLESARWYSTRHTASVHFRRISRITWNTEYVIHDLLLHRRITFRAATAVKIQVDFFGVATPCSVVVGYQRFGRPWCFCLQGEVSGVMLQLTVSQSVSQSVSKSWLRIPSRTHDQMFAFKTFTCFFVLGRHPWREDGCPIMGHSICVLHWYSLTITIYYTLLLLLLCISVYVYVHIC